MPPAPVLQSVPQQCEVDLGFPLDYTSVATKAPLTCAGLATRARVLARSGPVDSVLSALLDLVVAANLVTPGLDTGVKPAGRSRPSWNDAPAYDQAVSRDCPLARQVTLANACGPE